MKAEGATASALPEQTAHAAGFRQARRARRSELVEDYVELIADLVAGVGEARQVDIAARLGVAQPTVAKMLARLQQDGYIRREPYRGAFLTPKGEALATASRRRHALVERLLVRLGVSPQTARRDAEGIEHYVSPETLEAIRVFLDEPNS